ncbi:MAG TPA: hypothetical protein VM427_06905 [Patescibacteria group bacterium]|nr:hypothetical protein [Patescibacteria group bacterium]
MDRDDWLLLFLAQPALNGRHVAPMEPLKVMKGMFLVTRRGGPSLSDLYEFEPYDYGPFTRDIYRDLDSLRDDGLVAEAAVPGRSWRTYRPTEAGIERALALQKVADAAERTTLDDAHRFVATRTFLRLLRDIYAAYPDFAVNTVVKDAAPQQRPAAG